VEGSVLNRGWQRRRSPTVTAQAGRYNPRREGIVSYYRYHVFFCCNQRAEGEACCNNHGASDVRAYAKDRVKALGLAGPGRARVNQAGCLDRCAEGPVMVIYPEEVWYTYVDQSDVDEIIDEHLRNGRIVERLRI
jgi:(2Fe-2S) ferredoxin